MDSRGRGQQERRPWQGERPQIERGRLGRRLWWGEWIDGGQRDQQEARKPSGVDDVAYCSERALGIEVGEGAVRDRVQSDAGEEEGHPAGLLLARPPDG